MMPVAGQQQHYGLCTALIVIVTDPVGPLLLMHTMEGWRGSLMATAGVTLLLLGCSKQLAAAAAAAAGMWLIRRAGVTS
jgi:hypothetical protein